MKCLMMMMGLTTPAFAGSLSAFEVLALAVVVPLSVALFFFQDKLVNRMIVFALAVTGIYGAEIWWSSADQPEKSAGLAIQQLNGANPEIKALRTFETAKDAANVGAAGAVLLAAGVCFGRYLRAGLQRLKSRLIQATPIVLALAAMTGLTGCLRAYDRPEYAEIDTSETGFLIPLEGENAQQAKFEAQKKENERIELEANAVAEKARREAQGLADARKLTAAAEGAAIREVNNALNETQQVQLLSQLKTLEVEKARVEKWDGKYPTYFMGGAAGNPNLLIQVPTPVPAQASR